MNLNKQFLVLILFLSPIKCQESQYEYSIEVPKYLCDKNEGVKNGTTTIRLLGKDAQKLQYDFAVDFRNTNNCRNQRCTLMTWRAVRDLEKYLKKVCATQEYLQEISIDNTMLVPGIQYILNIAVTNKGTPVDTKQFMLECTNESSVITNGTVSRNETVATSETVATTETSIESDTVTKNNTVVISTSSSMSSEQTFPTSFVLIGTNVTYRDMLYILNAETEDCNINCNYYYKWEIFDNLGNLYHDDYTKGSELQISPDFLKVEETYMIKCSLINGQDNTVITTAIQNLKVLKRDMILKLAVSTLLVGIKRPFKLAAYFQNIDNPDGKINTKWSCKSENQKDCLGFEEIRVFNQEKSNLLSVESKGLLNIGSYRITLTVSDDSYTKQDTCMLKLIEDGFVKIDIDVFEELVDPSKDIEVPAYVSGLIASCMLQWTNVKSLDYKYLNQNIRLGNINVLTNITLTEDEFLNEIDEFSNNTIDMEYNLKIPPPKDDLNWKGLESNSSYLFRLNATCPIAQREEDNDEDAEPLITQNYVTLCADVILHTDCLPVLNSLDVVPKRGVALKTLFRFIYEDNGSNSDYPILYKFGYFLKDEIIFVSNLLGVTNAKGVLPYINNGVKTVLEGCNSHSLCSKVLGPVIITEIPTISDQDHNNLMEHLRELMGREEYNKMFTYSLAILQTYNSTNDTNLIMSMENFISNLTSFEIKRLLMKSVDGDTSWIAPANNLMRSIGLLLNKFPASQILLNNIVALRNELARKSSLKLEAVNFKYLSRRMLMLTDETYDRKKRDVDKMTMEEVKNYLAISELIITTSPDRRRVHQERENLINQIDKFMPSLCANLYYKSRTMNLELKTLILSVEKINRNTFNRYIHILFPENTWNVNGRIKLGKCFTEKLKMDDQLCLGKAVFKNYLGKKGFVYMIKIYNAETIDQIDLQEIVCDSVFIFPVEDKQLLEKEAKCVFWKKYWTQSQCKTLHMKNRAIQCACTNLGYYSLEYVTPLPVTSVSSTLANIIDIETSTSEHTTIVDLILSTATSTEAFVEVATEEVTEISTEAPLKNPTEGHIKITTEYYPSTTAENTANNEQITTSMETLLKPNEISDNISLATLYNFQYGNLTVHYLIIGTSLCGIVFLIYGIRRLLANNEDISDDDFPRYAPLYHEEMLQDLPQSK